MNSEKAAMISFLALMIILIIYAMIMTAEQFEWLEHWLGG